MQFKYSEWWPVKLDHKFDTLLLEYSERLLAMRPQLNLPANLATINGISSLMKRNIKEIIERDSLPHFAHLINGWGDGIYQGKKLSTYFKNFVQNTENMLPCIIQCDPEGDFHPWQSFAYYFMAGGTSDLPIVENSSITLAEIIRNSTILNTADGCELGHLLYSVPFVYSEDENPFFDLKGKQTSLATLIDIAIDAHISGHFEVCRKLHLTEGLCRISKRCDEQQLDLIKSFLKGQLDVMLLLGLIKNDFNSNEFLNKPEGSIAYELREKLVMQHYIENHIYYVGHLTELACLAFIEGFTLPKYQIYAIIDNINHLNQVLGDYLDYIPFHDCFLSLGHYRRGITLFEKLVNSMILDTSNAFKGHEDCIDILKAYTVDFDKLPNQVNKSHLPPPKKSKRGWNL